MGFSNGPDKLKLNIKQNLTKALKQLEHHYSEISDLAAWGEGSKRFSMRASRLCTLAYKKMVGAALFSTKTVFRCQK